MRARTIVMLEIPEDRSERHRLFKAIDDAFSGADPTLRTRIDDLSTPLEDAEAAEFAKGATLLRQAMAEGYRN